MSGIIRHGKQLREASDALVFGWPDVVRPCRLQRVEACPDGGLGLVLTLCPLSAQMDGTYDSDGEIRVLIAGSGERLGRDDIAGVGPLPVGGEVVIGLGPSPGPYPQMVVLGFEPTLTAPAWDLLEAVWAVGPVQDGPGKDEALQQLLGEGLLKPDLQDLELTFRGRNLISAHVLQKKRSPSSTDVPTSVPLEEPPAEKKLRLPASLARFLESCAGYRGNDFTAMSREILFQWAASNGYKPGV